MAEFDRLGHEAFAFDGAFDKVDFVIAATNPGPAFAADAPMSNPSSSFVDSVKANRAVGFTDPITVTFNAPPPGCP